MTVDQIDFSKWLITLGVGGILAGFMFMFYRKDIKQYTELWRINAEMMVSVIKENTASNIRLIALLESVERNQLRKEDIPRMVDRHLKETIRWEEFKPGDERK
jgi:hypothetical protein